MRTIYYTSSKGGFMNKTAVINWLQETEIPLSKISVNTGVSRRTLYNWLNGEATSNSNLKKIETYYFNEINSSLKITGKETMLDTKYIIDLQKDKIETQNNEIKTLKKALKEKQAESVHWEALEFDFLCNVTLFRNGLIIGRVINSVTEIDYQAKTLGYTKKEMEKFWDIGVKYTKLNKHPIEKIIDEKTSKNVQKQALTLPVLFDSLKSIVGDHYIPQPMIYIHKDGHKVPAMTYNKVEWRTLKVTAKVKFLN